MARHLSLLADEKQKYMRIRQALREYNNNIKEDIFSLPILELKMTN